MVQHKRRAKTRIPSLVVMFALVFAFAHILNFLSPLSTPAAEAVTPITETEKRQCFDKFNNKDIILSELSSADQTFFTTVCFGKAYCTYTGDGAEIGSKHVSCPNPNEPSEDTKKKAADAEVAPLVKLACGDPPAGEAAQRVYLACASKVKAIYLDCSMSGGGPTSEIELTPEQTAQCAVPRINAVPEASDITVNAATAAIAKGRGDADAIIDAEANARNKQACEEQGGTWNEETKSCTPKVEEEEPSCSGGSLGWIICPVIDIISNVNDTIFSMIETQLFIDPVSVKAGGPLYQIWTTFRDIANVAFVIAFIVVVYSQATGAGLNAYGIKKMLPRLLVTAILVNLSFFLCQFALDLSNIIGKSLGDMITAITPDADNINVSWDGVVTALIAAGAVIGATAAVVGAGGVAAAAALLLPFAVTALFAALTAIVILIARQALIILLIAIAPIAFVAFILPNTAKYFERWREIFVTMLILYPFVAILFAGSKLAAFIILSASSDPGSEANPMVALSAVMIMFLPLFGVPLLLKFSGGLLGRIGAFVNNPNKGPFDALRKRAERYGQFQKNNAFDRNLSRKKALLPFGYTAHARKRAKREALYASAERRAKEAETGYIGGLLEPDKTGNSADERFARRMAGGSRIQAIDEELRRVPTNDQLQRVRATGIVAADEVFVKDLKAAQGILENARVDGANLRLLQQGKDAVGMNGQKILGSDTMQLAATAQMMSQGRQMDKVVENLAQSDNPRVRSFIVGQIQSSYSTAKQKQIGLIDEPLMARIASADMQPLSADDFKVELRNATVRNINRLTPEFISTQESSSVERLVTAMNSNQVSEQDRASVIDIATRAYENPQTRRLMTEQTAEQVRLLTEMNVVPPNPPTIPPLPMGGGNNGGGPNNGNGGQTPPDGGQHTPNNPPPAAPAAPAAAANPGPAAPTPGNTGGGGGGIYGLGLPGGGAPTPNPGPTNYMGGVAGVPSDLSSRDVERIARETAKRIRTENPSGGSSPTEGGILNIPRNSDNAGGHIDPNTRLWIPDDKDK